MAQPSFEDLVRHASHMIEIIHAPDAKIVALECYTCSQTITYRRDMRPAELPGQTSIYDFQEKQA